MFVFFLYCFQFLIYLSALACKCKSALFILRSYKTNGARQNGFNKRLWDLIFTAKDVTRDSYTSITRLQREVRRIRVNACNGSKDSKNSYSLWFSSQKRLIQCFMVPILGFGTSLLLTVLYNEKVKFSLLYFGLQETNITELWFLFLCCVLQIPCVCLSLHRQKISFLVCCRDLEFPTKKNQFEKK